MAEAKIASKPIAPQGGLPEAPVKASAWRRTLDAITVPFLAIFTSLVIGGIIIAFSDDAVLAALPKTLQDPFGLFRAMWNAVSIAYTALLFGAIGQPDVIAKAIQTWVATGNGTDMLRAMWPLSESLVTSTPYIYAGLAVAVGFKAGLFNIGVEGQLFMGALASAYVGYAVTGLPWFIHLPLAMLCGMAAGAIWAAIPGFLKARTGAHEVINTMMMNYIAFLLSDWLLNGPMKAKGGNPRSPEIAATAYLPALFPEPVRFHWGFFLALGAAFLVYWFLWKTTLGFELRTVGASPSAARYAGMNITRNFVLAMVISGGLAGLTGANELLGLNHYMANAFSPGYGFDSIALALLGKSNPFGVVLAALLFGFLRSGATRMQSVANVPVDIISILQALIIVFIAAPAIVRWLYRVRAPKAAEREVFTRGWGG
ncbi:MAG: ABC transporter permease [Anaerolineae bacterium]